MGRGAYRQASIVTQGLCEKLATVSCIQHQGRILASTCIPAANTTVSSSLPSILTALSWYMDACSLLTPNQDNHSKVCFMPETGTQSHIAHVAPAMHICIIQIPRMTHHTSKHIILTKRLCSPCSPTQPLDTVRYLYKCS